MYNYTIFISWVLTTAYCFLYFGIFSVRRYGLFIIDDSQVILLPIFSQPRKRTPSHSTPELPKVGYVFSRRGLKLIIMGLMASHLPPRHQPPLLSLFRFFRAKLAP
jgi:hypothetical protein